MPKFILPEVTIMLILLWEFSYKPESTCQNVKKKLFASYRNQIFLCACIVQHYFWPMAINKQRISLQIEQCFAKDWGIFRLDGQ